MERQRGGDLTHAILSFLDFDEGHDCHEIAAHYGEPSGRVAGALRQLKRRGAVENVIAPRAGSGTVYPPGVSVWYLVRPDEGGAHA